MGDEVAEANRQLHVFLDNEGENNFDIEVDEEPEDRNGDGALDGGVAHNPEGEGSSSEGKRKASECDLMLHLSCKEVISVAPDHPILQPEVTVSIGLDKNTKLSAVFARYVEFCNEQSKKLSKMRKRPANSPKYIHVQIDVQDLEFLHSQLLNGNDTAEASALMKNDKILVRRMRAEEREETAERKRILREADRTFFQQLRHLLPDLGGAKTADIILDCRGKLGDESGRNQQVLCTTVRTHSAVVSKRCPWLGAIIQKARNDYLQEKELLESTPTPDDDGAVVDNKRDIIRRVESSVKSGDEEDDDEIAILSFSPKNEKKESPGGVAEIENDDEDDEDDLDTINSRCSPVALPANFSNRARRDLLWVTLPNHSPEAVKLLLEYCYTNRVLQLGQDAFVQACKTRPHKHQGPVPPFTNHSGSRRWPQGGLPNVSFPVALSGICLAEEAGMHRLSLMCEIASASLLTSTTVAEALAMCSKQKALTGNDLPHLRKAAMEILLRSGPRAVVELGRSKGFRRALEERSGEIVPTLLQGTLEIVTEYDTTRNSKRGRAEMTYPSFEELDREDSFKRERERRKRRIEQHGTDPKHSYYNDLDEVYDDFLPDWILETSKRSLKRMTHHTLEAVASQQGLTLVGRSSEALQPGYVLSGRSRGMSYPPGTTGARRTSSRRTRNSRS